MKFTFAKKLALGACWPSSASAAIAADPIKIGSVLSVTGPAAFLGDPELKTLQMYVEDINKKGGVLGRPLQLVHYDDGSDAGKANGFGKRLIDDDKVDIMVGGTTTGATMSMVPLVEKAGMCPLSRWPVPW
jgi:branched-chain amino acid transport system substrate-binding protein